MKKLTQEEFLSRCKSIHGNKYDYSLVNYKSSHEKIKIICPKHGIFQQVASEHSRGRGCKKCAIELPSKRKSNTFDFIEKAKKIHDNKYDYSLVEYKTSREKIKIICPFHGHFWQVAQSHLQKTGCPKCKNNKISNQNKKNIQDFIIESEKIHNNKYDYSLVNYERHNKKIIIICPIHGKFLQVPSSHLKGCGCPKCGTNNRSSKQKLTFNDFVNKSNIIHLNKYTYNPQSFISYLELCEINCPIHGKFKQKPRDHLQGHGCKKCSNLTSSYEEQITSFLDDNNISYKRHYHIFTNDSWFEIDIFLPDFNIGIEINGLYWHRELNGKNKYYHLNKTNKCKDLNITLIHIFSHHFKTPNKIFSRLKSILNLNQKIGARKTTIRRISFQEAKTFLDLYHLQNSCISSIQYGLFYNDELISVMTFGKKRNYLIHSNKETNIYELLRFACKENITIVGGANKLLQKFENEFKYDKIISYADMSWSNGNMYEKLGFKKIRESKPCYWYFKGNNVYHRSNFMKHVLKDKLDIFDDNLSEYENMLNNNYDRYWDCGNLVFEKSYMNAK